MSEKTEPNDEPKIIIDNDWKSQVAKEKEELKQTADTETIPSEAELLPPPSFLVLLSTLATQAMAALGFIPDPISGEPQVNRPMAKHFIDTLAMLQEKTNGNLDDDETAHLRDALHQLRMAYVASENNSPSESAKFDESNTGDKPPTIELP